MFIKLQPFNLIKVFLHKSRGITLLEIYEILNRVVLPYSYILQTNYTEDREEKSVFHIHQGQ